jgi:glyoxylase-like metal-dependent hydrolase (beta-lactamase superfamily II)
MSARLTIVNVGYRSTNYWVVSSGTTRLLVDIGWPGTMATMRATLARMDVPLAEIRYVLATHYHIDHAGLAQEFKQAGAKLLVVDVQRSFIPLMKAATKPGDGYVDIALADNVDITCLDSRATLARMGIGGEIIHTPGHSADSVTLLLDDGSAFTGDLTAPGLIDDDDGGVTTASWQRLRDLGAKRIYPGHGPARDFR